MPVAPLTDRQWDALTRRVARTRRISTVPLAGALARRQFDAMLRAVTTQSWQDAAREYDLDPRLLQVTAERWAGAGVLTTAFAALADDATFGYTLVHKVYLTLQPRPDIANPVVLSWPVWSCYAGPSTTVDPHRRNHFGLNPDDILPPRRKGRAPGPLTAEQQAEHDRRMARRKLRRKLDLDPAPL
jgi:hypothetical protein